MLDTEVVGGFANDASVRVVVKNEAIWRQGSIPRGDLLFLARGRVEYLWQRDSKAELVDVRDVGDLLGLTALVERVAYQVSAIAVEDCLLYALPWPAVSAALDLHDEARNYVHRHLFWVTRFGGAVSCAINPTISTPSGVAGRAKSILQAHLDSAQIIVVRDTEGLVTCNPRDPIWHLAEKMVKYNIDSVIVIDNARLPIGIVTASDLVHHVIGCDASKDMAVESVMSEPVITVAANSSSIAAMLLMMQRKVSNVCVTADGTRFSPALDVWSDRDLMSHCGHHPAGLLREIGRLNSVSRARELNDEVERLAGLYLVSGISSILVGQICAELYDEMTNRLLTLARNELAEQGETLPNIPWAWMSVGSDGRREQILRNDMDNALVFESSGDFSKDDTNRSIFLKLTTRVVEMLVECGFSRCQGGVMASNPKWCRTDREWQEELELTGFTDSNTILRALVLYDLRYIAGDASLVPPLRKTIFTQVPNSKAIMTKLAELVVDKPPPLNFLGRFVVEKRGGREIEFDLKHRGLAPFRDAARLFALKYGLSNHYSTGSRWEDIGGQIPELRELALLARECHEELMRIRILNGLKRGDSGRFLDPESLSKLDRTRLAYIFDVLRMVQQYVRNEFRTDSRYR